MKKSVENRTMAIVLEELNNSVDKYNESSDAMERVQLANEHKNLVAEYNELSLLSAYANFMKAEVPVIALAKAYYYDTVSTKDAVHNEVVDGVQTSSVTRAVAEGVKKLDVTKFIIWTEERNKSVAATKTWKAEVGSARRSIENEWKKFFASKSDEKKLSIGSVKKATQKAFDAIVFVPCENDKEKNAIIANSDIAKVLIAFANKLQDKFIEGKLELEGTILPPQTWNMLLLTVLHMAVENKNITLAYGTEIEDAKAKPNAKPEEKTDSEEEPKA